MDHVVSLHAKSSYAEIDWNTPLMEGLDGSEVSQCPFMAGKPKDSRTGAEAPVTASEVSSFNHDGDAKADEMGLPCAQAAPHEPPTTPEGPYLHRQHGWRCPDPHHPCLRKIPLLD